MRRNNKVMAFCIALSIVFSNGMINTFAEGNPTITISNSIVEPGEIATITVNVENNPGISAWQMLVDYDTSALELKDVTGDAFANLSFGDLGVTPFSSTWIDSQTKDDKIDGTALTLTFAVKDDAVPGNYAIDIECEASNKFEDDVVFDVISGNVQVKEPEVSVTGLTVTPTSYDFKKAGETITLTPKVLPEKATNKKVTYKSSDEKVATVDATGKVTAVKEGSAEITVITEDGGYTAVCKVTVAHEHSMSKIDKKSSTCTVQGNNEYYKCDSCGKYFKDADGKNETTVDAEKLPLIAHKFTKQDISDKYLKSKATCTSKAVYYYSCEVCGEKGTETFEAGDVDKTNHVGETEIVGAKEATCDVDGYTGDIVCKSCEEIITKGKVIPATEHNYSEDWKYDEETHWRECTVGCGTIIDEAAHKGGEATCVKKAACEVCGAEYGEVNHDNHKGESEIRGYVAPTVEAEGYTGDTYCLDCGELIKKGEIISAHIHKLIKIDPVEATHFAPGNIEYYECEEDGMLFKDEGGTVPVTLEETIIPQIPHSFSEDWKYDESKHWHECECGIKDSENNHSFGEWTVATNPTEETEGTEERICSVCGANETRAIPKLDPSSDSENEPDSSSNSDNSSSENSSENSSDTSNKDSSSDTSSNSESKPDSSSNSSNSSNSNNGGSTSKDSPIANTGGNANPNTGAATSAASLGVIALGALVVSKKRK